MQMEKCLGKLGKRSRRSQSLILPPVCEKVPFDPRPFSLCGVNYRPGKRRICLPASERVEFRKSAYCDANGEVSGKVGQEKPSFSISDSSLPCVCERKFLLIRDLSPFAVLITVLGKEGSVFRPQREVQFRA
ncbi:hypothetical protein CDAR_448471 [Caerostris darwini]|uniref:Uncharacterized protein n=1 Tax=Caerostris darwini TaxID=1538125 RepID=A0AAV4QIT7_9ARAC|nr:hypothetical protein CDAR_448471 [Caerostris darwini]